MDAFVATLLISIVVEILKERNKLFNIKPFDFWGWAVILALGISTYFAWGNNQQSDLKIQSLIDGKKSVTDQLISARVENRIEAYKHEVRLNQHSYNTEKLLAEYNLKIDTANDRIEKIRPGKNPPFITHLPDSSIGLTLKLSHDTLYVGGQIYNAGEQVAFDASYRVYFLMKLGDKLLTFSNPLAINHGGDIDGGIVNHFRFFIPFSQNTFESFTSVYCVILGKYFLDPNRSQEKRIEIGLQYNPKEMTKTLYNGRTPIAKLLEMAEITQ